MIETADVALAVWVLGGMAVWLVVLEAAELACWLRRAGAAAIERGMAMATTESDRRMNANGRQEAAQAGFLPEEPPMNANAREEELRVYLPAGQVVTAEEAKALLAGLKKRRRARGWRPEDGLLGDRMLRLVAYNVRARRGIMGLTCAQLAEAAGLSVRTIGRVESGKVQLGAGVRERLADGLRLAGWRQLLLKPETFVRIGFYEAGGPRPEGGEKKARERRVLARTIRKSDVGRQAGPWRRLWRAVYKGVWDRKG